MGSTDLTFPPSLKEWLATLPPENRAKEVDVAYQNLRRIANHLGKK